MLSKAALVKRFVFCSAIQEMKEQTVVAAVVIGNFVSAFVTYYDFDKSLFVSVPIIRLLRLDERKECASIFRRLKIAIKASADSIKNKSRQLTLRQRELLKLLHVPFSYDPLPAAAAPLPSSAPPADDSDNDSTRRDSVRSLHPIAPPAVASNVPVAPIGTVPDPQQLETSSIALQTLQSDMSLLQACCRVLLPDCVVERVLHAV